MKTLIKLEELAQLLACIALLVMQGVPWWAYLILLLGPDISMLGYVVNTKVGAFTYNLFHHKGLALLVVAAGGSATYMMLMTESGQTFEHLLLNAGIILYGHSSMDRMLGYGLKFGDHFQHTHLGWIGKGAREAGKL